MPTYLSIVQSAKGYTVYPEIPLKVTLPAAATALSIFAVVVLGNSTGGPFNTSYLDTTDPYALFTVVPDPTVVDDETDTFTKRRNIINLYQEISSSPVLTSPDASGYYLIAYVFTAPATAGAQVITVSDPGVSSTYSPPLAAGKPMFDGGITAVVFEIAGSYLGSASQTTYDSGGSHSGYADPLLATLTPGQTHNLLLEVGIMMDSSSITPAAGATLQHSGSFPAGSSFWTIQTTIQASATAAAGFANPIEYTGGVIAVSFV